MESTTEQIKTIVDKYNTSDARVELITHGASLELIVKKKIKNTWIGDKQIISIHDNKFWESGVQKLFERFNELEKAKTEE